MQERFGYDSTTGIAHVGTGVMRRITRAPLLARPFLRFGTLRNLLFPEHGTDVPFTVANYAYRDRFGRETITWHRTFDFGDRVRCFDATMIWSERRGSIIDYLGTHQHLATDLRCWVDAEGGINFAADEQRFVDPLLQIRCPRWFGGEARVREWYDDELDRFRIRVAVSNQLLGPIFGYEGDFTVECIPVDDAEQIPAAVLPRREVAAE